MQVVMFTDGAAKGNPGPGGYGTVLLFGPYRKELSEGYRLTTNNRMELLAVIKGLEAMKKDGLNILIYSDSKYVVDSVTKGWIWNWMKTGFKGKKNEDLWRRYITAAKPHNVKFQWVKGHAGNPENERCDQLAVIASQTPPLLIDDGYEAGND
ncbi:ribonuclease HI [Cesiribacter sp. SM1]|uniref:ribonuclease HI n=1 Tax=Cesiribacter sp. SM1 TaxID=2861196 RepID=UPI001CD6923D|nr:ribonuclease HI [Cesiribacter sp. SM1]